MAGHVLTLIRATSHVGSTSKSGIAQAGADGIREVNLGVLGGVFERRF